MLRNEKKRSFPHSFVCRFLLSLAVLHLCGGSLNIKKEFTEQYKNALLEITKEIIKGELDIQLESVHPAYDMDTMSANWTIGNLFAAMYFSLFYMRPEYEIYRPCANPNCNRLFKVKTTNDRRKYHDHACQNAAAQMRHRKKKREESPSAD